MSTARCELCNLCLVGSRGVHVICRTAKIDVTTENIPDAHLDRFLRVNQHLPHTDISLDRFVSMQSLGILQCERSYCVEARELSLACSFVHHGRTAGRACPFHSSFLSWSLGRIVGLFWAKGHKLCLHSTLTPTRTGRNLDVSDVICQGIDTALGGTRLVSVMGVTYHSES